MFLSYHCWLHLLVSINFFRESIIMPDNLLMKTTIFIGFELIKALLMMILWNLSIPNIFESVSEITWLESFCILTVYNILTKTKIEFSNKE